MLADDLPALTVLAQIFKGILPDEQGYTKSDVTKLEPELLGEISKAF
jgi:hypothetical protein